MPNKTKEAALLIGKDAFLTAERTYLARTKRKNTFHSPEDLESTLKELLLLNDKALPKLTEEDLLKFLGHMGNQSGSVSSAFDKEKVYDLENWNQRSFLYLQAYSLLASISSQSSRRRNRFLLIPELLHAINAYRILQWTGNTFSNNQNQINPRVRKLIEEIKAKKKQFDKQYDDKGWHVCDIGFTVVFPCGSSDHAMYLNINFMCGPGVLLLRMDNLGAGVEIDNNYHRVQSFKKYSDEKNKVIKGKTITPAIIGRVDIDNAMHMDLLVKYLAALSVYREKPIDEDALQIIYNDVPKQEKRFPFPKDFNTFTPMPAQIVNNCVYKNYEVGIKYRLPTSFDAFLSPVSGYIFSRAQTIKKIIGIAERIQTATKERLNNFNKETTRFKNIRKNSRTNKRPATKKNQASNQHSLFYPKENDKKKKRDVIEKYAKFLLTSGENEMLKNFSKSHFDLSSDWVNFSEVNCSGKVFTVEDFSDINFCSATLTGITWGTGVSLYNANLRNASLKGAINLKGSHLQNAKNVREIREFQDLRNGKGDSETMKMVFIYFDALDLIEKEQRRKNRRLKDETRKHIVEKELTASTEKDHNPTNLGRFI